MDLTAVCIAFGSLFLLSAITIILTGIFVAKPGFWAQNFQEVTCEYVSSADLGSRPCSCSDGGHRPNNCRSKYPCYSVAIKYRFVGFNESQSGSVITILYDDEAIGVNQGECSFVPYCDRSVLVNTASVEAFLNRYGKPSASYPCFYNPGNSRQVIRTRRFGKAGIITSLAIPGVFLGISATATTVIGFILWKDRKS